MMSLLQILGILLASSSNLFIILPQIAVFLFVLMMTLDLLLLSVYFFTSIFASDLPFSFIALGDWGGAAIDSQDYKNVYAVSKQMNITASAVDAKFIINTGDNFYWCGIQNTSDFQIQKDFLEPYNYSSLQLKWYSTLGNHEYGYNVDAQIEYGQVKFQGHIEWLDRKTFKNNWVLSARYYTTRLELASGVFATLLVMDTSPCVTSYRNSNPKYWDPCSTTYPTCSFGSTDDDFEGECEFNANILSQDCTAQYNWVRDTLATVPSDDWFIVVGHHPLDEVDVLDFTSLIQNRGFSIYLNGHAHSLTRYTIDNKGAYVTSGAGSLVNTYDQSLPTTALKVSGGHIPATTGATGTATGTTAASAATSSHSYQTVYTQKVAGFTLHTFSSDFSTLRTDFVSYTGSVVYSFTVNKAGTVIA